MGAMFLALYLLSLLFQPTPAVSSRVAETQTIQVLVLDALSGKPQVGAEVKYYCDDLPLHLGKMMRTDETGVVKISVACRAGASFHIMNIGTTKRPLKEGCGEQPVFDFQQVVSTGIVSDPTRGGSIWCPTRVSKKLKPVPGQVTLFIKKPTWYQEHFAG